MPDTLPLAIVADVGGTNTRVALADGPAVRHGSIRRFRNADFSGLDSVLAQYLEEERARPDMACVAIAGPIEKGIARLTNLDWRMDKDGLSAATGAARASFLNDLQAQAHALPHLAPGALRPVCPGEPPETAHAARLVVGVGTGFNIASLFRAETGAVVPPSETGHISLPLRGPDEASLGALLEERFGFASVEEVLSGRGLELLYRWRSGGAGRPAAEIVTACADAGDPVAETAVADFVRLLGRVAGDLALIQLPFGGLHFSGGVARSLAPHFARFGFADAFRDKGRFSGFMERFPVSVIEDDYAALTGSAAHLADLASRPS